MQNVNKSRRNAHYRAVLPARRHDVLHACKHNVLPVCQQIVKKPRGIRLQPKTVKKIGGDQIMDKCFMTREKLSSGSPEKGSEDIPLFANMHTLSLIKVLFIVKLNNSLHAYLSIITK